MFIQGLLINNNNWIIAINDITTIYIQLFCYFIQKWSFLLTL